MKIDKYKTYRVEASSFEGRLPLKHKFIMCGKDEKEIIEAIKTRWPYLYDIKLEEEK